MKFTLLLCLIIVTSALHAQQVFTVSPLQVNPGIARDTDQHFIAINDSVPSLHKLFLFFPGTGGIPRYYQYILRTAANLGYHAIGLTYVNDTTIANYCIAEGDSCEGMARKEVFFGKDFSNVETVDSIDGIRARLIGLLGYLNTQYPADDWAQFFAQPDSVDWTKVCVSGHSQGAGMASIIAYWFSVYRGAYFAVGGDFNTLDVDVSAWMGGPSATPPSRKYSFDHRQDELFWGTKDDAPIIFDTLGLLNFGPYISVDTLTTNFYGAHAFTSNLVIPADGRLVIYHDCVAVDGATPITNGVPVYQPVWQYMLTDTLADTVVNTGVHELNAAASPAFKLYPNPASNNFIIETSAIGEQRLEVFDITGQLLLAQMVGNGKAVVDVSGLEEGVYIVALKGPGGLGRQKLVVKAH